MGIHDGLGLKVCVLIDGAPAPEYQDQSAEDQGNGPRSSTTLCHRYIESVAGSRFSIYFAAVSTDNAAAQDWFNAGDDHVYRFQISIDGKYVGSTWISRRRQARIFNSVWDQDTPRLLQFSAVDLIEDAAKDLGAEYSKQFKDIGIIRIEVYAAILTFRANVASIRRESDHQKNTTARDHHRSTLPSGEGSLAISEKALKGRAITHGATLGPAVAFKRNPAALRKHWQLVDPRDRPRGIFTFAYRSKNALKQELIIPRSPSPALPDLNDLPPEEIYRLAQERLSEIQDHKRGSSIKHERTETNGLGRPLKLIRISGGREAIDLTDE